MLTQLEFREEMSNCSNQILYNSSKLRIFTKRLSLNPDDTKLKAETDSIRTELKRNILEFSLTNM